MANQTFGSALRGWREARGLSINALSQQTGIGRRTIDRAEGDVTCKVETLARLVAALQIDDQGVLDLIRLATPPDAVVGSGVHGG